MTTNNYPWSDSSFVFLSHHSYTLIRCIIKTKRQHKNSNRLHFWINAMINKIRLKHTTAEAHLMVNLTQMVNIYVCVCVNTLFMFYSVFKIIFSLESTYFNNHNFFPV